MAKLKSKTVLKFSRDGSVRKFHLTEGIKKKIEIGDEDFCPVCGTDLKYDAEITKRIAIMDSSEIFVKGWVCPDCFTEFDMTDKIKTLLSNSVIQGIS